MVKVVVVRAVTVAVAWLKMLGVIPVMSTMSLIANVLFAVYVTDGLLIETPVIDA
jgi:hypothetical protein